jgi:hypothetical protein
MLSMPGFCYELVKEEIMQNENLDTFRLPKPLKKILFIFATILIFALLSRQVSIYSAIRTCSTPHLAQDEIPLVVHVQLSTNEIASKLVGEINVKNRWAPVWYVALEGKWHVFGGPPPEGDQPEMETGYYDHCSVVVNFFTGSAFRARATSSTGSY